MPFTIAMRYAPCSWRHFEYGLHMHRFPDGARFNVFFLQSQPHLLPIHTELFRRDQNNREPAVLFPKGCFGHKFDAGKIVERLPNKRRLTKEYQGVDWELNRKGSDFSFILKYP